MRQRVIIDSKEYEEEWYEVSGLKYVRVFHVGEKKPFVIYGESNADRLKRINGTS